MADNGRMAGGAFGGGPYYDSNAGGQMFSVPPDFYDSPHFYSGVGTYFHADVFPVWDVFTPTGAEMIDVGDTGLAWGFEITCAAAPPGNGFAPAANTCPASTPEPTTLSLFAAGGLLIALGRLHKRKRANRTTSSVNNSSVTLGGPPAGPPRFFDPNSRLFAQKNEWR